MRNRGKTIEERLTAVEVWEFKELLSARKIRPAFLEDVSGTHHQRKLYKHPNTQDYYVEVK